MGFTAAAIFAPNVPDKVDPIRYLTAPPETKAQEQAQVQARSLAYAWLRGMDPAELERVIYGAEARKPAMTTILSKEEQEELQKKKTCVIPTKTNPPAGSPALTIDYPYMFTNFRVRNAYQFLEVVRPVHEVVDRSVSSFGKTKAPVIEVSLDDFGLGSKYIEKIKEPLEQFGIVKLRLPPGTSSRLPFGPDVTGFKTKRQTVLRESTEFDYRQIKRGFFRALIRFHSTSKSRRGYNRLPQLERKAVDFFRLFHLVELHGGSELIVKRKEWAQIGRELGYSSYALPTLSSTLRHLYARVLQPFKDWLFEQLPTPLDPHRLPRLDVDDVGASTWHRLPGGIVVDISQERTGLSTRRILDYGDVKKCAPSYTLKLFKQIQHEEDQPLESTEELERRFLNLPEWHETEHTNPPVKLIKFPKEAAMFFPTEVDNKVWDPWDITSLSMRDNRDFIPYIANSEADDLLLADLDIAANFATRSWYRPSSGTYEVNMLVDGHSRTWYSKNGCWVDQGISEVVIVHPETTVLNWSHGYSAVATTRVLLNSDWLTSACKLDLLEASDAVSQICVQHVVYQITSACERGEVVPRNVRVQAVEVLDMLKQHELELLRGVNISQRRVVSNYHSAPIKCPDSKKLRFFSWVEYDGVDISLEAYIQKVSGDSGTDSKFTSVKSDKVVLITRYDDAASFFESLKAKIFDESEKSSLKWALTVDENISHRKVLPKESLIRQLLEELPRNQRDRREPLEKVLQKLEVWRSTGGDVSTVRGCLECLDDGNQAEGALRELSNRCAQAVQIWNELFKPVIDTNQGPGRVNPDAAYHLKLTQAMLNEYGSCFNEVDKQEIKNVEKLVKWTEEAWALLHASNLQHSQDQKNLLFAHRVQGRALDLDDTCQVRERLNHAIKNISDVETRLRNFLTSASALKPNLIINFKETYLDPIMRGPHPQVVDMRLLEDFNLLYESIPLLTKMLSPHFPDRPRRSEVTPEQLKIHGVALAVGHLERWLDLAKGLDWSLIALQLKRMMGQDLSLPAPGTPPISIQDIASVYTQLFQLRIVPDDVEGVKMTFENTMSILTQTAYPVVIQFGFTP